MQQHTFERPDSAHESIEAPETQCISDWLWKRSPKPTDGDKGRFKRMVLSNLRPHDYAKRWFQYHATHGEEEISYFKEQPMGDDDAVARAGFIPLWDLEAVKIAPEAGHSSKITGHSSKIKWKFVIQCSERVYELGAPTEAIRDKWITFLNDKKLENAQKAKLRNRLTDSHMDNRRRTDSKSILSIGHDFHAKMQRKQRGNVKSQHATVTKVKNSDTQSYYTGNLAPEALSLYSENRFETTVFFNKLVRQCNANDSETHVRNYFDHSTHIFLQEGEKIDGISPMNDVEFIYYIIEGEVIRTINISGESHSMCACEIGDWIGPAEFHACGQWMTHYVCFTQVVLIKMPIKRFVAMIRDPMLDLTEYLTTGIKEITQQVLMFISLFDNVDHDEIVRMAQESLFQFRVYQSGEIIIKENDPALDFFIVVAGRGNISRSLGPGFPNQSSVVATVTTSDHFGELGLLKSQPRAATVTSIGSICLVCTKEGFDHLFEIGGEEFREKMNHRVETHLHRFIVRINLFSSLETSYDEIARVMEFQQLEPETILVKQGKMPDGFYAIVSGSVQMILEYVIKPADNSSDELHIPVADDNGDPLVVGSLRENETFGEVSCGYRNVSSSVTYKTETPTVVLFIPSVEFGKLLVVVPDLRKILEHKFHEEMKEAKKESGTVAAVFRHYRSTGGKRLSKYHSV